MEWNKSREHVSDIQPESANSQSACSNLLRSRRWSNSAKRRKVALQFFFQALEYPFSQKGSSSWIEREMISKIVGKLSTGKATKGCVPPLLFFTGSCWNIIFWRARVDTNTSSCPGTSFVQLIVDFLSGDCERPFCEHFYNSPNTPEAPALLLLNSVQSTRIWYKVRSRQQGEKRAVLYKFRIIQASPANPPYCTVQFLCDKNISFRDGQSCIWGLPHPTESIAALLKLKQGSEALISIYM